MKDLEKIFCRVLDLDELVLTRETTANDIEEWDSLTHVQLIVAIEKFYKIKFNSSEIRNFKNVGDLLNSIESKLVKSV
jgi:acyl carrier protein